LSSTKIIAAYEGILAVTAQMLGAARAAEWDRLIELEHECRLLVQSLMLARSEDDIAMEPAVRKRKFEIIRKVLADDAEIRNLTEPWMQRLQHLLGSIGQERKLQAAYGDGIPG
jgi:flagellar protein FliT